MRPVTVDAVYTWVDGGRPDYLALLRQYTSDPADLNPERFRDLYTMLRYSLRSLELYAPWVRNVWIVTCRPQVPAWLDTTCARVRVVHHDEIFERAEYLPTFNSNVIESYLHRVPSDADYLLYLNDEYFFGRETPLECFLTADGRIRVHGTFIGEAIERRIYEQGFVASVGFLEHNPPLIHRGVWEAMLASRPEELHRMRTHRFRSAGEIWPDKWYRYFLLKQRSVPTQAVPIWQTMRFSRLHKIKNHLAAQQRALAALARDRPHCYCMNDDQELDPDPEVMKAVRAFLDTSYPRPSMFER